MLHPHTELRFVSEAIGYGVFATRFIPRGTITWVRDELDRSFASHEIAAFSPPYRELLDRYCFVDGTGAHVLCWDLARFMNHSCRPTCLSAGYDFEIAVRDIRAGEELTDDYGTLNLTEPFHCGCGEADCRGDIDPGDPFRLADRWDAEVAGAFPFLSHVSQPLWSYVREQREVELALETGQIASCRAHFGPSLAYAGYGVEP